MNTEHVIEKKIEITNGDRVWYEAFFCGIEVSCYDGFIRGSFVKDNYVYYYKR